MRVWSHSLILAFVSVGCATGPDRTLGATGIDASISIADFPTGDEADRNENGHVCRKEAPQGPKKFPVVYTDDSDDESQPCPPGFELVGVAG